MFEITPSARLRPSPYYESTLADGVCAFTTYNRMLMPTSFGNAAAEYWRITNGVSMWDVACERQVQLKGPDAGELAQILAPRDLSKINVGHGKYVPLCNHDGILINDPIALKLADDLYWFSIADSNIWFWARGLKYFWFRETHINGIPVVVARSGWSKHGGFEIFLRDGTRGTELWNIVKDAGQPYDIGPGNPSWCERVESGLISYGGDTDRQTNPFEVRMGKYVDLQVPDDVVGNQALRRIAAAEPKRHSLGVILDSKDPIAFSFKWNAIHQDGDRVEIQRADRPAVHCARLARESHDAAAANRAGSLGPAVPARDYVSGRRARHRRLSARQQRGVSGVARPGGVVAFGRAGLAN